MKEKIEEKPEQGEKVVRVQYGGTGGWALNIYGEDSLSLGPGDTFDFYLNRREHLHALINILKQINERTVNTQVYIIKGDPMPFKQRERFKIISGMEHVPEVLQKIKFRINNAPTNEERKAILSLCPDYFEKRNKKGDGDGI